MNPLKIRKYFPHFLRRRFEEKIIIIESDDWGMERLICGDTLEWMKRKFGEDSFTRWSCDSLETSEDLELLFELLERYKSKFNKPPIITANFITHNIDYDSKDLLCFKPLTEGFNTGSEDIRELYRKGIEQKIIYPQLHGFSHYNVSELKKYFETDEGREAHRLKFMTARSTIKGNLSFLQGEFSLNNFDSRNFENAVNEFRKFFGFCSNTIIPPAFIFNKEYIKLLCKNNIHLVQSSNRLITDDKMRVGYPYFRKIKSLYWSVRNCRLDPNPEYGFYHDQCLKSVSDAFSHSYPAVIDFHRVNFSGKFNKEVRERTLHELKSLFDGIHKNWPDAVFMNTSEFSEILWQQ